MSPSLSARRALAARKVRAARGWAGISQPELAHALEISVASVRRIEQFQRDVSTAELIRIGEICEVPRDFMLYGFQAAHEERADSLETIIEDMAKRVERHERLHELYRQAGVVDETQDTPGSGKTTRAARRTLEAATPGPDLHTQLDASVKSRRKRAARG